MQLFSFSYSQTDSAVVVIVVLGKSWSVEKNGQAYFNKLCCKTTHLKRRMARVKRESFNNNNNNSPAQYTLCRKVINIDDEEEDGDLSPGKQASSSFTQKDNKVHFQCEVIHKGDLERDVPQSRQCHSASMCIYLDLFLSDRCNSFCRGEGGYVSVWWTYTKDTL